MDIRVQFDIGDGVVRQEIAGSNLMWRPVAEVQDILRQMVIDRHGPAVIFADTAVEDLPDHCGLGRECWAIVGGQVVIDLATARSRAHTARRDARAKEFAPYDEIIAVQIPGEDAVAAEAARAAIRTKYATIQTDIDNAADVVEIKAILDAIPAA